MPQTERKQAIPPAVYILGLAIFAMGTSEFMLAGLLPDMAADLGVSIPDAGLLISAFALGMVVGAPVLALATLRLPRRLTLLSFLAVFVLAHIVGALVLDYEVLLATRILGALVYAGFFGVATVAASAMVAPASRAKALAIVVAGVTVSTVLGVPAGTLISQYADWRAAFWAVAALTALAFVGVLTAVPSIARGGPAPRIRNELRAMASLPLWVAYGAVALSFSSMMATFSYLGAMLTDTTGLAEGWVPAVLALFGLGCLIGITVGGRVADEHPFATLYAGMAGVIVTSGLVAVGAAEPAMVVASVFFMGVFGMASNPAVSVRVFTLAGEARTLAGASVTSVFNIGNTLAPWLGGLVIGSGFGYAAVPWVGVAMASGALLLGLWGHVLERRANAAAEEGEKGGEGKSEEPVPVGV
ncbi:Cmx/CmrA family chloramphenicol efflux MFS transporter [Salininema proteolyticum]|uniref:Cmx/CmrA family chloramphenicol efflux MFS transporter n=1 Tax=Salininema proteolyticum TaxID=1607685 RepID=A0ABV8U233_9ACTN